MVLENKKKKNPTFLVVDSDGHARTHVIDTLHGLGYRNTEEAADGAAAFHILKRRPVDCIISAWDMPQMNGLTLLKILSADEALYQLPFIIMSRKVDRETVIDAGKYGVSTILLAPVTKAMLEEKINGIFGEKKDVRSDEVKALMSSAQKLSGDGKYQKALAVYNQILDMYEDAEIYYNIGYINVAQGKYDEALIAFRKAVMVNNLHGRAFKKMGDIHLKMDEPEKAEAYFQKAGDIFLDRELHSAAETAFKEVLKLNPKTTNVYNSLGIIYRKRHNYKEAIKMYQMALKVDSDDENIYYNLGRALLEDKRVGEAKKMFGQAMKIAPDFSDAKRMLQAIEVGFK